MRGMRESECDEKEHGGAWRTPPQVWWRVWEGEDCGDGARCQRKQLVTLGNRWRKVRLSRTPHSTIPPCWASISQPLSFFLVVTCGCVTDTSRSAAVDLCPKVDAEK